jgi:hypothetical protein
MIFNIPIKTISEANSRDHWAIKAKRAKSQRLSARIAITLHIQGIKWNAEYTKVILTRIGKRKLDSDNLARSMKAIRDGIADVTGIDDGDERITWEYKQEIGKAYSVKVEIK